MKQTYTWRTVILSFIVLLTLAALSSPRVIVVTLADEIIHEPEPKQQIKLIPELVPVCACESSFEGKSSGRPSHYEPDGITVRWGRQNPNDRGICQINRIIHSSAITSSGFDVETEEGNIAFANKLYGEQGYQPWSWSFDPERGKCHWES